ncbi:alpha/beta hydrolase family protein [Hydrogenoanaerobacterium sp.]|uniref:alpha/beta hydrolase n=1 Tax=Hydrogenoanaerobacterium sp. TaxID=2953763 RepID=UPI0028976750|nr:alpha/beta hydrolase family protein [Hydrogenoanaerobacterium sp.]
MALFQGSVRSECLGMQTNLAVFLPDGYNTLTQAPKRVLYLLHGLTDGYTGWLLGTSVCRYAQAHNLAVIMPEGHRSFYCDVPHGSRYFSYVSQELPKIIAGLFRLENDPSHTYIAGNSMGGYGALKCYYANPSRYAGCAAFSPVISVDETAAVLGEGGMYFDLAGLAPDGTPYPAEFDLRTFAAHFPDSLPAPHIIIGTEDFLYPQNIEFQLWLNARQIPCCFETSPGAHDWDFWDTQLNRVLNLWFSPDSTPKKQFSEKYL